MEHCASMKSGCRTGKFRNTWSVYFQRTTVSLYISASDCDK